MSDPYDSVYAALGRELDIQFLGRDEIEIMHEELVARYGGIQGVRDPAALEGALARPMQAAAYAQAPSLAELGAALSAGIIQSHPFVDGNKRTGFRALCVFLGVNGQRLDADPASALSTVVALASGQLREDSFARWVARHTVARDAAPKSPEPKRRSNEPSP